MHIVEDASSKTNNPAALAWSLVIVLSLLLFIAGGVIMVLLNEKNTPSPSLGSPLVSIVNDAPTGASPSPTPPIIALNKKYTFSIKDGLGTKIGEIIFTITQIQRTKEVMVAGQKATTLPGRDLIVVDVELENSGNLTAVAQTRNYLRLAVNNIDKLQSPEYHPDPVTLDPQSVKEVRFGFSIAETDQNIVLQVGELDGTKDLIPLNF